MNNKTILKLGKETIIVPLEIGLTNREPEPKFRVVLCWVKSEEYNEIHSYLIDEIVSSDLDYDKVRELYEQIDIALSNAEVWIQ